MERLRRAANTDDKTIATTDWARDGRLKKQRSDNFVDFTKENVLIQSGNAQYEGDTVVGITDQGEYVFYDVVNLNPMSLDVNEKRIPHHRLRE